MNTMEIFHQIADSFAHSCYSKLGSALQFEIIVQHPPELAKFFKFSFLIFLNKIRNEQFLAEDIKNTQIRKFLGQHFSI